MQEVLGDIELLCKETHAAKNQTALATASIQDTSGSSSAFTLDTNAPLPTPRSTRMKNVSTWLQVPDVVGSEGMFSQLFH